MCKRLTHHEQEGTLCLNTNSSSYTAVQRISLCRRIYRKHFDKLRRSSPVHIEADNRRTKFAANRSTLTGVMEAVEILKEGIANLLGCCPRVPPNEFCLECLEEGLDGSSVVAVASTAQ